MTLPTSLTTAITSIGFNTIHDDSNRHITHVNANENESGEREINLIDFSRLYKVGQIPIVDFFIVYIFLHFVNLVYFKYDYSAAFIATIPTTVIIYLLTNRKYKISFMVIIIMAVCVYLFHNITSKN